MASSRKHLWLIAIFFVTNLVFVTSAFAIISITNHMVSSTSTPSEKYLDQAKGWNLIDETRRFPEQDLPENSVRIDRQRLMKLALLVAEYKQAYEDAQLKLQDALSMNEEMVRMFKLQERVIEELKAKITSMKKEMIHRKSQKVDNADPTTPLKKPVPPTA
jgi:hypothetical protein